MNLEHRCPSCHQLHVIERSTNTGIVIVLLTSTTQPMSEIGCENQNIKNKLAINKINITLNSLSIIVFFSVLTVYLHQLSVAK